MKNQPLGGNDMPRFAGPNTFMRLPSAPSAEGLDVAFIGIPMDIGTSWRPGTRFGPKAIRAESAMLRPYNMATKAAPFDALQCADIGDVAINTFDLKDSVRRITDFYDDVLRHDVTPMTMGGDHTLALPVLRSIAKKHGPVGLIHVDAHADINQHMFGEEIAHGTPFRRAYEEGLIDAARVWQIGLRGTGYAADDFDEARGWGFNVVQAEKLWMKSLVPLAAEVNAAMGAGPVYISFDIDSLDPAYAPGTGTPEICGLTPPQAVELIRGMAGLNIVGCDLVEVSPPYDATGNTAVLGAN
ncbi:MAG: guanidinobutyrase, partial [Paracoccaceae bacterium]